VDGGLHGDEVEAAVGTSRLTMPPYKGETRNASSRISETGSLVRDSNDVRMIVASCGWQHKIMSDAGTEQRTVSHLC
jgi:hypothetical protein